MVIAIRVHKVAGNVSNKSHKTLNVFIRLFFFVYKNSADFEILVTRVFPLQGANIYFFQTTQITVWQLSKAKALSTVQENVWHEYLRIANVWSV